jgi:cellulose synthase/poly-beta-1,6-N-acetylglucosamine synthase-like glycosyltransferase
MDNGSRDSTASIARAAINRDDGWVDGEVFYCSEPGKSKALNFGLWRIREEIVVRVDADTTADPSLLQRVAPYFLDPKVGAVGGKPLPRNPHSIMGRIRSIELVDNFHVKRMAQGALDSVMVLTGRISAYRCELLRELGGFGEGFNGEDTDVTVQIGRLGYKVILDPSINVFSDEPPSLGQLREQRLRWSRSAFHVTYRNFSALWMGQGMRGLWFIPTAMFGICRRAVVVPILIYALVVAALDPGALYLRQGAAIVAVVLGPQILLFALALVLHRKLTLLPLLPMYMLFRLFRAYIALESMQGLLIQTSPLRATTDSDAAPNLAEPTPASAGSRA